MIHVDPLVLFLLIRSCHFSLLSCSDSQSSAARISTSTSAHRKETQHTVRSVLVETRASSWCIVLTLIQLCIRLCTCTCVDIPNSALPDTPCRSLYFCRSLLFSVVNCGHLSQIRVGTRGSATHYTPPSVSTKRQRLGGNPALPWIDAVRRKGRRNGWGRRVDGREWGDGGKR